MDKKLLILVFGAFSFALGFKFFMQDYEIVSGGITGFALIIATTFNIDETMIILLGNISLLIAGYNILGKTFLKNTIIGSLLFPLFVMLIPSQHLTDNLFIVSVCGGFFTGIGIICLYLSNGSTGGTTIIAKILHHYTDISFSHSMAICDGTVVIMGFLVFGFVKGICALVMIFVATTVSQFLEKKIGGYSEN